MSQANTQLRVLNTDARSALEPYQRYRLAAGKHALCTCFIGDPSKGEAPRFEVTKIFKDRREYEAWQEQNECEPNQKIQWVSSLAERAGHETE